ncbi:hypothetical protein B9T10_04130 [Wohlfahrtiimonas chitiniclastica]|uniref:helix-turn-helix transcriptional regulator n=1 Tax=Wohlfahrtiimonas chitiniclastica TaxID=400946 RepID=UPI000B97DB4F|nr:hypothetical protein [Wohlfahrtiimonas chitiniclastica]OYQ75957.1 hypothetical protein B9T18_00960 [Wohlfahrtiimonas chitiniclastica]OYQ90517.1 hypothetical protein B9T10_04130 [Wohlfahrtiimonas chitiniclastica]
MNIEMEHHLVKNGQSYILVKSDKCLSTQALADKFDVHVSHIRKHIVTLLDFPAPIHFEEKSHPRWLESEIDLWLQTRKKVREW